MLDSDMAGRSDDLGLCKRDGKAYSTFYTEPWNAVLLASLALDLPNPDWHLADPSFYRSFKVADFACGGGMLLLATYHALGQRAREASARSGKPFSMETFHREFVEVACHGFDVMERALEMTRGALAGACEGSGPVAWNLALAPMSPPDALGSLDLLKDEPATPALRRAKRQRYQLVIMNPPFARSCGDNLQFGAGTDDRGRMAMDKALTRIRCARGLQGIGQAGQAADFIVLAVESLAPGGRLAFIVPKSLIDGAAWLKLRRYLLDLVHVELLAFNFVPPGFSFSENTSLSECMLVARRRDVYGSTKDERTAIVNISRVLTGIDDVQAIVNGACKAAADRLANDDAFSVPSKFLVDHVLNWQQLFGLPTRALHSALDDLVQRSSLGGIPLQLVRLGDVATVGPDRSELTKKTLPVEAGHPGALEFIWGRENEGFTSFVVSSNQARAFKDRASVNIVRKFGDARSHLLLPESIFLKTTRVFGCFASKPVLSNVSWSCKASDPDVEKVVTLWSNTTPGILLLLGVRNEARGPWIHWKKVSLQEYRVPALENMSKSQRSALAGLFDRFHGEAFSTLFDDDPTRDDLDCQLVGALVGDKDKRQAMEAVKEMKNALQGLKRFYG